MARIRVTTVIDAPPERVWDEVRVISRHVDWMADADRIDFRTSQREGTGTAFVCVTKIGPIRLKDEMSITHWKRAKAIGVRLDGVVTGEGTFTLTKIRGGRTRFTWDERLRFPRWLGGPVGGLVGGRILKRVWKANLARLKVLVEADRT